MKSSEVYDIELRFIRCPVCGLGFAIKQPNSKAVVQAVEAAMAHAGNDMTRRMQGIVNGRRVECQICGAGWRITKATDLAILEAAVTNHLQEHEKIKAERPKEPEAYRGRMMVED